ncbi:hypothetical protein FOL47_002010, partial [Perkinsus chesapeaki]
MNPTSITTIFVLYLLNMVRANDLSGSYTRCVYDLIPLTRIDLTDSQVTFHFDGDKVYGPYSYRMSLGMVAPNIPFSDPIFTAYAYALTPGAFYGIPVDSQGRLMVSSLRQFRGTTQFY